LENVTLALMMTPAEYDANQLHDAIEVTCKFILLAKRIVNEFLFHENEFVTVVLNLRLLTYYSSHLLKNYERTPSILKGQII
jgi:hypothetical protein